MNSFAFALRQRHVCSFRNWVLFQENERLTCLKSYFVTSIQITIHNAQIGYILLIRSVQIEFCTNSIKFEKKNNEWMMPITLYTNFSVCANSIQTKQPHRVERHISFVLGNLLLYMTHRYFFLTLQRSVRCQTISDGFVRKLLFFSSQRAFYHEPCHMYKFGRLLKISLMRFTINVFFYVAEWTNDNMC